MTPPGVAAGYAELMGRYALPLFVTQTFKNRSHPEAVAKAHRYFCNVYNRELHGNNWQRKGFAGLQSVLGIERHKSGWPHAHAVIGHPDLDIAGPDFAALRRSMQEFCTKEWGWSRVEVAKSTADCSIYVAKYVMKEGDIVISPRLEALATGQLSLRPASFGGAAEHAPPSSHCASEVTP